MSGMPINQTAGPVGVIGLGNERAGHQGLDLIAAFAARGQATRIPSSSSITKTVSAVLGISSGIHSDSRRKAVIQTGFLPDSTPVLGFIMSVTSDAFGIVK